MNDDPLARLAPYLKHDEVCLVPPGPGADAANCICRAGRELIAARAGIVARMTARFIACGRTWFNDKSEALTQAMRRADGYETEGGCGARMDVTHTYRCAECGRWMHLSCLKQHFKESRHDQEAPGYRADRYEPAQPADSPDKAATRAPVTSDTVQVWRDELTRHAQQCRHCRWGALPNGRARCPHGTYLYERAFPTVVPRRDVPPLETIRDRAVKAYNHHRRTCPTCRGKAYVSELCDEGTRLYCNVYRPALERGVPDKPDDGAALSELIETIRGPIEEAFKGVLDDLFRDRR